MKKKSAFFLIVAFSILKIDFSRAQELTDPCKNQLEPNGSLAINWRNIGPEKSGYEYHVQNQVYLSDVFLGTKKCLKDKIPLLVEFQIPTANQGKVILYRLSATFNYNKNLEFELGKFLVPFGHYNELYRSDHFLSLTRPLLYASPDSLDLVARPNLPRPPQSAGRTDLGLKASYFPKSQNKLVPSEITLCVVNGLGEINNRLRGRPYSRNFRISPPSIEGTDIDFGHLNNNLEDNNNLKEICSRIKFALGDLKMAHPISERKQLKLKGLSLSFSGAHSSTYALERGMTYGMIGTDLQFQYQKFSFVAEYIYSENQFSKARGDLNNIVNFSQNTNFLPKEMEINNGYYLQGTVPIWKKMPLGERLLGIVAFNRLERRGPKLIYSANKNPDTKIPILIFPNKNKTITTSLEKYTFGLAAEINDNFLLKGEFSYWDLNIPPVNGKKQKNNYQFGTSLVISF